MYYNPNCHAIGEGASSVREDVRKRVYAKFEDDSYKLKYFMDDDQFQWMKDCMAPRPISYDNSHIKLQEHTHPVPAELQNVAYGKCLSVAKNFAKAIDIGGSLYRSGQTHHICSLIGNCRDEARQINCILDVDQSLMNVRAALCTKGAQNCNYQAPYGYSVNVYDIPFDDIPLIMEKHGMVRWDIWMFLPLNLIDPMFVHDQTFFENKIFFDGRKKKCRFSLLDNSNAYVHDYTNWRRYFTVTAIKSRYHNYNVEHIDQRGPMTCIRITQTTKAIEPVYRVISLGGKTKMCMVPDLFFYFTVLKAAGDMWTRVLWVDEKTINSIRRHSQRQGDNMFNFCNFASHMDGLAAAIYYVVDKQQKLLSKGIDLNSEQYKSLQISLYIICAIDRFERTQTIGRMFEHLKKCDGSFLDMLFHEIRVWFRSTVNNINALIDGVDVETYLAELETKSDTYFRDARVKTPPQYVAADVIIGRSCRPNKKFVMPVGTTLASGSKADGASFFPQPSAPITPDSTRKDAVHGKLAYNPPGDGSCGLHALRWFAKKHNVKFVVPAYILPNGVKKTIPDSMHSEEDIAYIARHNRINLISHFTPVRGAPEHISRYIWDETWPTLKLRNESAHWTVIDCDCQDKIYVGTYCNLPIEPTQMYINCANDQLTDGAGQAADFRIMFPGYDKGVKKPVPYHTNLLYNGNLHLGLSVAIDARQDPSKKNQFNRVRQICIAIENYALANDLVVYMPMIGTAIFGNDLCCVKKLVNEMKCRKVVCVFNDTCLKNYLNTLPCTHAGYTDVASGAPLTLVRDKYNASAYNQITPNFSFLKMEAKYRDIETKLLKLGHKSLVELACAPGAFAAVTDKKLAYTACHFLGGDFELRDNIHVDHKWSKYSELPDFNETCLLLDYCVEPDDPFVKYAIDRVVNHNCHIVSKFAVYHDAFGDKPDQVQVINSYGDCKVDLFRNDASSDTSSEMYYIVSRQWNPDPLTVNIDLEQQKIDEQVLEKQLNTKCVCKASYVTNAELRWTNDQQQFNLFKKQLAFDAKDYDFYDLDFQKILDDAELCIDKVDATLGVAGACKSQQILKSTCGLCSLLIAPMRKVVDQHGKVRDYSADSRAVTFVKAISILADTRRDIRNVFIDEIFLINPYYVNIYKFLRPDAHFHALGDVFQIKTDFHGTAPEYRFVEKGPYLKHSKRVPACLDMAIGKYIPGFAGNKSKKNRMEMADELTLDAVGKHDLVVCHTQKVKAELRALGFYQALTAHEAMGSTYPKVHVYTHDISEITRDKASYVYTAMSRTAGDIVFYGNKGQIEEYFTILGSSIERAAAAPQVDVVPHGDVKTEAVLERETIEEPRRALTAEPHDISSIVETLAKIYPAKNEHIEGYTLQRRIRLLPEITEPTAFLKISPELLQQPSIKVNGKILYSRQLFCQTYHGKDVFGKVGTAIKRYLSKRKFINKASFNAVVKQHLVGLKKFLKPEREWSKFKVGHEAVLDNFYKYARNLQKKYTKSVPEEEAVRLAEEEFAYYGAILEDGKTKEDFVDFVKDFVKQFNGGFDAPAELENKFSDIAIDHLNRNDVKKDKYAQITIDWHDPRNRYVNFHMKSQPKEIRKLYWDVNDKAGQGISAYGKMHNILLCALQTTLHDWVVNNLKSNVIWAVDRSDEAIAEQMIKMGAMSAAYDERLKKFCCDATEFDSTQLEQGIAAICVLAQIAGCPEETIEFYRNIRAEWTAMSVDELESLVAHMKFTAKFYMTSGSLMTLTGNTVYNMMMIGACYNFHGLAFAAFKGDDSFIIAESIKHAMWFGVKFSEFCGYKLKDEYPNVPEFIANFITPLGFFPDVLRRVSRVCSRLVTHPDQWIEIRQSIRDCLDVIHTPEELHVGCKITSIAYQEMGLNISEAEVYKLAAFLHQAATYQKLEADQQGQWEIVFHELDRIGHNLSALGERLD